MHRASHIGLVVLAALSWGCAGDELPEPSGDAELVIGGADASGTGFIALDDGAEVELIPGGQGGFHVWIGMEVSGAAGQLYLERDARRVEDDTLVLRAIRQAVDVPDDAMVDWWRKPDAVPSFMCPSPLGVQVFDREIEFRVWLTDEDGTTLGEDSISLVPRCPEGDQHDFCVEICSG